MRILVLTGNLFPIPSNNARLIMESLQIVSETHDVAVLSTALNDQIVPGNKVHGFRTYQINQAEHSRFRRRFLYPALTKVFDPFGSSDITNVLFALRTIKQIRAEFSFDAIITTSEPYPAALLAAIVKTNKKLLYLMDPPECIRNGKGTPLRNASLKKVLKSQNVVFTTPFIWNALLNKYGAIDVKIEQVGFPMISSHNVRKRTLQDNKIRLLFSGWMCSELRSPKYFLEIVTRLDSRFEIVFMGRDCELLQERFPTDTNATLITLPNQPYDVALQAIADADVLINIGNSVPVHMPSKTLEYINTGKPMVNFYKFSDCPTLYYTKRYPLALNLFEEETDLEAAATQFIRFCEENVGKTVDREYVETEFVDCTPQYIAQKIIESLEK